MPFAKTVQGPLTLMSAVASGADATLAIPTGTSRPDWATVDPLTLQVVVNGQNSFKPPKVVLKSVGSTIVVTNNSGLAWNIGDKLTISAREREVVVKALSQTEYDAAQVKDVNTIYFTTGS